MVTQDMTLTAEQRARAAQRCTWVGFACNGVLSILKILAGIVAHSSAMVADGVHSISDFLTDIIVIVFVGVSAKGIDESHRYGHGKYETFATFLIAVALAAVAAGLFCGGATKVYAALNGIHPGAPGKVALWAAVLSIVSKEALYRYTRHVGVKLESMALEANAWHHRSDAFSSVATLLGIAGAIFLNEQWRVLDPLAGMAVSVFIVVVAWRLAKPAVQELLEVSLPDEDMERICSAIARTPGVRGYHNLRSRHNGSTHIVDLHIKVDGNLSVTQAHDIASAVEQQLRNELGHVIANIHIEPYKGECVDSNGRCSSQVEF